MTTSYHNKIMADIYRKNDDLINQYLLAIKHLDLEIDRMQKDRDVMKKELAELNKIYQEFEIDVS